LPKAWDVKEALELLNEAKEIKQSLKTDKWEDISNEVKLILKFAFTATGVFNPLCAFFGGYVA